MSKPTSSGNYREDFDRAAAKLEDCLLTGLKVGGPQWVVQKLCEAYNTMYGGDYTKSCMSVVTLVGEVWNESEH